MERIRFIYRIINSQRKNVRLQLGSTQCVTSQCSNHYFHYPDKNETSRRAVAKTEFYSQHNSEHSEQTTTLFVITSLAALLGLTINVEARELTVKEKNEKLLLEACKTNDLATIRHLIKLGIDVNVKHKLGWTPLMVAAVNGHYTVVKILLNAGANPNVSDDFSYCGRVAQEKNMFVNEVGRIRCKEFSDTLDLRADFRGSTALHYASLADNDDILDALIHSGADPLMKNNAGYKPAQFATDGRQSKFKEWEQISEQLHKQREAEMRKRYPLEQRLRERIVGQEGAINVVASAVRRKENGWFDDDHPLVMLFLGSSGIGKTELAKRLAEYLHGENKNAFIRIDMSEYQSKHEAAKFIGAPPGYVGHEEGGQLTERLSKQPSAVVLFDEVDKAHPDVLTTLLQLFDEGHLTDGKGKKIRCKDATFIMTANVANEEISQHAMELRESAHGMTNAKIGSSKSRSSNRPSSGETTEISREFKDSVIQPILKRHFKRDEFLGRINEIVYFLPFTVDELHQLVKKQLDFWAKKAKSTHNMELTWRDDVFDILAKGFDIHYGARSIIYEVERQVVSKLASAQEKGLIKPGDKLVIAATESGEIQLLKDGLPLKNMSQHKHYS